MNRLHARIAVSEAAAWTARASTAGAIASCPTACASRPRASSRSRPRRAAGARRRRRRRELRILFIGQAVERKGLPVLLRAFEALREHVPATLTLVGAVARRRSRT